MASSKNGSKQKPLLGFHKATGRYYKRYRDSKTGRYKFKYFTTDLVESTEQYLKIKATLESGETPVEKKSPDEVTVEDVVNKWNEVNSQRFNRPNLKRGTAHGISPEDFFRKRRDAEMIASHFAKRTVNSLTRSDLDNLLPSMGAGKDAIATVWKKVNNVRSIFKFAMEEFKTDKKNYSDQFDVPSTRERKTRRTREIPLFEPSQIRFLVHSYPPLMRAAVLLGINCGFYSKCLSDLKPGEFNGEWYDGFRHKTAPAAQRIMWLWPETQHAVKVVKAKKNDAGRLLLSPRRKLLNREWCNTTILCVNCEEQFDVKQMVPGPQKCVHCKIEIPVANLVMLNPKAVKKDYVGMAHNRMRPAGCPSWKSLRHTFCTIGMETRDSEAVAFAMGHVDNSVTALYDASESQQHIIRVSKHIRSWLWSRQCGDCGNTQETAGNIWTCDDCEHQNTEFEYEAKPVNFG